MTWNKTGVGFLIVFFTVVSLHMYGSVETAAYFATFFFGYFTYKHFTKNL